MTLKFYYDLMSQPSRAVYMFLRATNIPFESCLVKLRTKEHLKDEYAEIHPFHQVPAISDSGFKMIESVAILRYLAKSRKVPDHWYPSDLKQQARVDEYLEWQHTNTRRTCFSYFTEKFMTPLRTRKPVDEEVIGYHHTEMVKCLGQIENVWLGGGKKKFLAGDQISIADLMASAELEQPGLAGYDVFTRHPIIGDHREHIRQEIGQVYEEAHGILRMFIRKYQHSRT